MNLEKLFNLQKELDQHIIKEKGLEGQDLLPKKILALQVELGELANEWRGFKFWKVNQQPVTLASRLDADGLSEEWYNPLLEEYVDCLHFILSIGNETIKKYGMELKENLDMNIWREKNENTVNKFNILFASVSSLYMSTIDEFYDFEDMTGIYSEVFEEFIQLGQMLDFTWEQIEQAYLDKNEVNHARQESGY